MTAGFWDAVEREDGGVLARAIGRRTHGHGTRCCPPSPLAPRRQARARRRRRLALPGHLEAAARAATRLTGPVAGGDLAGDRQERTNGVAAAAEPARRPYRPPWPRPPTPRPTRSCWPPSWPTASVDGRPPAVAGRRRASLLARRRRTRRRRPGPSACSRQALVRPRTPPRRRCGALTRGAVSTGRGRPWTSAAGAGLGPRPGRGAGAPGPLGRPGRPARGARRPRRRPARRGPRRRRRGRTRSRCAPRRHPRPPPGPRARTPVEPAGRGARAAPSWSPAAPARSAATSRAGWPRAGAEHLVLTSRAGPDAPGAQPNWPRN